VKEPVIRLENISKSYDGGATYVIKDLNISISKGDFVALLGPSGCGKSTTLMMLCGLYRPTTGNIYFNGKIVNDVMPKDRNIGMVFQSYALYPNMNVFENIAFPLKQMKSLKKTEIQERIQEVAEIVKIPELLKRMPAQLSGGQQQRVAMCRALVKKPDILLLDEPMSNLDARLKLEVRDEIKKLQAQLGLTTIIVTHDQEEAMAISSHIAVMDNGRIEQYSDPEVLYNHPENLFVASFVGTPPMNFINGTLEKKDDGYLCTTESGNVMIPENRINTALLSSNQVILGIRPDQFNLMDSMEKDTLRFDLSYMEHLGKENLYKCYSGDVGVRVLAPTTVNFSDNKQLYARPVVETLGVFDKLSNNNISVH